MGATLEDTQTDSRAQGGPKEAWARGGVSTRRRGVASTLTSAADRSVDRTNAPPSSGEREVRVPYYLYTADTASSVSWRVTHRHTHPCSAAPHVQIRTASNRFSCVVERLHTLSVCVWIIAFAIVRFISLKVCWGITNRARCIKPRCALGLKPALSYRVQCC